MPEAEVRGKRVLLINTENKKVTLRDHAGGGSPGKKSPAHNRRQ